MQAKYYGLLLAILSPVFSSIATIFQSGASKLLTPLFVASVGSLLGAIIIFLFLSVSKKLPSLRQIKENRYDLMEMTVLRFVLGALVFAIALSITTGVKAIFFTKTEPYFVLFWYWLIQKGPVKRIHVLLLGIHIIGAIILSTGGALEFGAAQLGDVLIIASMGLFSLSYIPGAKLSKNMGSKQSSLITMGLGGLILFPAALLFAPAASWSVLSLGWEYMAAWVILFNVIGLTMWFSSLKTVKGWIVSALRAIGPIAGAPVAWLLFGETLSLIQAIAAVVVLITSVLIVKEHLKG